MLSKEKFQKSLEDVIHDIETTRVQLRTFKLCPVSNLDVSRVFASRGYLLKQQLDDLIIAKNDLERMIKELEEE